MLFDFYRFASPQSVCWSDMKIGIIAHLKHPIRAPFAGGLEAFTCQVAQKLTDREHEVILFASSSSEASGKLYSILDDSS